jgi:hypothetical protein
LQFADDGSVLGAISLTKRAGIPFASEVCFKGRHYMLWILAVLMGGLGVGYVTVRRKRKAEHKPAAAR